MGLSGRKVKQRIQADPRNLTWADDASKFGASYLAKFGWDSSQGLGSSGEGRTSHIKVSQKLDMLGIGAAQAKDPNGIAWKQNKDFESLLRRLNEGGSEGEKKEDGEDEENVDEDEEKKKKKKEKKEKKKREERDQESKEERKERKKRKREETEDIEQGKEKKSKNSKDTVAVDAVAQPKRPALPRHRAHRARAIAAKSMASKSAASISEILGIAYTPPSSTTTAATTPYGSLTPLDDDVGLEKLTTSTKSVTDYFKERLLAKASGKSTPVVSSPLNDEDELSRAGLGSKFEDDQDDVPRGGLGSRMSSTFKFASMFTSATIIPSTGGEEKEKEKNEKDKSERKKRKEERKREKAERKERKVA